MKVLLLFLLLLTGCTAQAPSHVLDAQTDIVQFSNRIEVRGEQLQLVRFESDSMEPALPFGATGIEMPPPAQLHAGDIISYRSGIGVITHRIISINTDAAGVYYTTKGDASPAQDAKKVRPSDIEGLVVGVIY